MLPGRSTNENISERDFITYLVPAELEAVSYYLFGFYAADAYDQPRHHNLDHN